MVIRQEKEKEASTFVEIKWLYGWPEKERNITPEKGTAKVCIRATRNQLEHFLMGGDFK